MKKFLLALQFLTVIPLRFKQVKEEEIADSMVVFPLVGLFLGLALSGFHYLFSFLGFSNLSESVFLVLLLAALSGGIHLDGLADSADALLSGRSSLEMLEIMRDARIGAMGVLSLLSVLLLKIVLLAEIAAQKKVIALLLMCVLGRWAMVLAMHSFSYAREKGKAAIFMRGKKLSRPVLASGLTLVCVLLSAQALGLFLLVASAALTYILGLGLQKKLGGISGDNLGAINEIIEVTTLLAICLSLNLKR
jgi:adenosylcobinamide-GDP ribazoletransferase